MYNQQQPANTHPIDKGYIKVIIGQYPKKLNGQPVMHPGTTNPVMSNKYAAIGEVTRWPSNDGGYYDNVEFYPGFTILDMNKNGSIFWDSQSQPAQQSHRGYQQASRQQA